MSAGLAAGRALTLAGIGALSATAGWLLVRMCRVGTWPGGARRWQGRVDPSFRPTERYPSQEAAGLAGGTLLPLFGLAAYLLVVRFGALVANRPLTTRLIAAHALQLCTLFLVGLVVGVVGGIGLARLAASMRGEAVFRFPDPLAGFMLGGGLSLALGGGIAAIVAGLLSLSGGSSELDGVALVVSIPAVLAAADAVRRASPIIRGMRASSRLSQGSSPFQAGR